MRLLDLDPRWSGITGERWIWEHRDDEIRYGVTFRCPHCDRRIAVLFKPFIDPADFAQKVKWALPGAPDPNTGQVKELKWWEREGETFADLTLRPSINVEGHWHGHITNGQIARGLQ